jgi:hypothetical protein
LHYIILKNSKEAYLKGDLAEGECVGKCAMHNDNEDRIGSDRIMCEGIYLESDLCSSKVDAIRIVDVIEYIHIKYMALMLIMLIRSCRLSSFNEKLCR